MLSMGQISSILNADTVALSLSGSVGETLTSVSHVTNVKLMEIMSANIPKPNFLSVEGHLLALLRSNILIMEMSTHLVVPFVIMRLLMPRTIDSSVAYLIKFFFFIPLL